MNCTFTPRYTGLWLKASAIGGIATLMIFFMCVDSARAQFSIEGGLSVSSFSYTDKGAVPDIGFDVDLRPHLGYDVEWIQLGEQKALVAPFLGIGWTYPIVRRLNLNTALSFTQKGINFSQHEYELITYKVRISYLEIPVMLAYEFIKRPVFIAEIAGGIYGDLALDARKKVAIEGSGEQVTKLENARSILSGFSFELNFNYKIEAHFLHLRIRSFTDMNDALLVPEDHIALYHKIQKVRNTGVYLILGYDF